MCLAVCWVCLEDAIASMQTMPKLYKWAGFKVMSSVSELELRKTPYSTYSSAAGADPAAVSQASRKVGESSCLCSFGEFPSGLMQPEEW